MSDADDLSSLAALLANPARARMLSALLAGQALTATELALVAGIAPSTASAHLVLLTEGGVLALERQGRHRYHRLAGPEVAAMLEGLGGLSARRPGRRTGPRDAALRAARVCYDHLAGERAVWLFRCLRQRRVLGGRDGCSVTEDGEAFFSDFGIGLETLVHGRRAFARPCLDWSERQPHLGGALGAAILDRIFVLRWASRDLDGRAVRFTATGDRRFRELFGTSHS